MRRLLAWLYNLRGSCIVRDVNGRALLVWNFNFNDTCDARGKDGGVCLKTRHLHSTYHVSETRVWSGPYERAE